MNISITPSQPEEKCVNLYKEQCSGNTYVGIPMYEKESCDNFNYFLKKHVQKKKIFGRNDERNNK
jgi:hypothetical protein